MGSSSGDQVIGYKYFANFLLFIGNPIENLIGINFDKRRWLTGKRVPMGNNGTMIYLHEPNLYGENEGGVSGTLCLKLGSGMQTPDQAYKAYMESMKLPASAYPYQSYISFSGGELAKDYEYLNSEKLQELADQYNDGVIPGNGFYVGNSGYMKEMLLCVKRTRIRNDGRRQWYEIREKDGAIVCEIDPNNQTDINIEFVPAFDYEIRRIGLSGFFGYDGHTFNYDQTYSGSYDGKDGTILLGYANGWNFNRDDDDGFVDSNWKISLTGASGLMRCVVQYSAIGNTTEIGIEANSGLVSKVIIEETETITTKLTTIEYLIDLSKTATIEFYARAQGYIVYNDAYRYGASIPSIRLYKPTETKGESYQALDINPIHKIREILTDDTAMNKPESLINDENFIKAADVIYDESLGVSLAITEKSCIDVINELCYHIEAGIRINRQTGLYEMVLFRDNWFSEDEIHTISESKIKSMQYEITNADEVINQVNVNYYDRENIKSSSFSISESGLIQTLGRVNAETLDFPYFMNMRNAQIVANWKLKQLSTGAIKGTFTTGSREARKWNRYDLIMLPWSKRWSETILVRIMSINLGGPTNNQVTIDFIEVVESTTMMNTSIVIDENIVKVDEPKPCNAMVFELPYFDAVKTFGERDLRLDLQDNPNLGYLCAIAEKPQTNSLHAALYVAGNDGFERVATVNYCETAYLTQDIDRMSQMIVLKNVGYISNVRVGSQIFINNEIMIYQAYDAATKILTVKRGALDTLPQPHPTNSVLYFADDFIAVHQMQYVQSESIEAKVITTTPSNILPINEAMIHIVEFNARAIRPYPPANVKINDQFELVNPVWPLNFTWSSRNRIQQTGGEPLGWFDGSILVEVGVSYLIEIFSEDTLIKSYSVNDLSFTYTTAQFMQDCADVGLKNLQSLTFKFKTIRDGFESLYSYKQSINLQSPPNDLVAIATNVNAQFAPYSLEAH